MKFEEELLEKQEKINEIIKEYLPHTATYQKDIIDAMNYSVTVGGKRIRSLLMMEVFKLLGGEGTLVHPFVAAIEMIHSYSLVHDDLPAIDNDDYRRGALTTHKKYGEAMAILAGDGLLNYAFETMCQAAIDYEQDVRAINRAMVCLSRKAGIYGMIGGQVVDIQSENQQISFDQLNYIHKNKTGALIEGAMYVGGVLAKAKTETLTKLEAIGAHIGMAFQIQDDILDVISTQEVLGKPINSDLNNQKSTYVSWMGLEASKEEVERQSEAAIDKIKELSEKSQFLVALVTYLIKRKK